jgi:hypothetical protein
VWLLARPSQPAKVDARGPAPTPTTHRAIARGATPSTQPAFDPTKLPPPDDQEPAPVIDEILVEKPEVCEGEENLITVRAHTTNNTDVFLHSLIDGYPGSQVPVRSFWSADIPPDPVKVKVFGRGNVATEAIAPKFTVKHCKPYRNVIVDARLNPNTDAEFDFRARLVDLGAKDDVAAGREPRKFEPVSWSWSFGDGQRAETTLPVVTHSYEERPQEALYSTFIVTVEVRDARGERLVGRHAHFLMNPVFEELANKGTLRLLTSLNPRFPDIDRDGNVVETVRVWHTRPDPVAITKATIVRHYQPRQEGVGDAPGVETTDPVKLLGQRDIPAGAAVEFVVSHSGRTKPDWSVIEYQLEGVTVEGWPARGSFSIMMPPPKPTQEKHDPVTEQQQQTKIRAAMRILGKQYVTDEDIWRLEREGRLDLSQGAAGQPLPGQTQGPPPSGGAAH